MQIFPWEDRIHHVTIYGIKILTIRIFVLLVPWHQKTNKAKRRLWSWPHPAPEGTIPAGHSSLGRVGTSPNRNQNLPHCTHSSLATSYHQLLLFAVKSPARYKPTCPSSSEPSTATPSLTKTWALPGFFTPCPDSAPHPPATNSRANPGGSVTAVPPARESGNSSPPQSHLCHSFQAAGLQRHRAQRGVHPAPQPFSSARVPNLWMMTPIKHLLCSETEIINMKVFWLPLSTPSRLSPTASLTAAANALWMGRTWQQQQPNALQTEMFYSANTHHKFPGWLWKPGGLSSAQKGFSCAALFTQNDGFPEEKTNKLSSFVVMKQSVCKQLI